MVRQRKSWYVRNPLVQTLGILALLVIFYVPIAFATSNTLEVEDKDKGSATKNAFLSINTTIAEVEEQEQDTQRNTLRIDVKDLKAERDGLEQQAQQLQKELETLKTQLQQKEAEVTQIKQESQVTATSTKTKVASTKSVPTKSTNEKTITAVATAYTAYCNGCSGTTTNGTNLRANPSSKVIAVDPKIIPLNTKVEVLHNGKSLGVYTAGDTGGAIKGNKIDIFMPSQKDALNWGVKEVTLKVKK